jgi:hypothetical protein
MTEASVHVGETVEAKIPVEVPVLAEVVGARNSVRRR